MTFEHAVRFELEVGLAQADAIEFVRDVRSSLARAGFLRGLAVERGEEDGADVVTASLPVNAALFGQRDLPFRSSLHEEPDGARLQGLPLEVSGPGWAQVSGRARVTPSLAGSRLDYAFEIGVHVRLPEPERWGGKALTKMVAYTAKAVLARVTEALPAAVEAAAAATSARDGYLTCQRRSGRRPR